MDQTTFRMAMGAAVTKRVGQQAWTTPGTYSFPVPMGVSSICAVCVAGAYGGSSDDGTYGGSGGNGADLRYINNLPVVPGEILTIEVGAGGAFNQNDAPQNKAGGQSAIRRAAVNLVRAYYSGSSTPLGAGPAGGIVGGGSGGTGGSPGAGARAMGGGGGGAGGYSGAGGQGAFPGITSGAAGAGGGGGGGANNANGGGVGILGEGASGTANGGAGSGGVGQRFGGGGGGASTTDGAFGAQGESGAVRIMWGFGRAFPSTRTADEFV